jgi:serine/threonine protein kinase
VSDPADARAPALADQLARADVKARLFGAPSESARVGRFAVLRRIGAGGMGVVYAAYDEELDRKVAIKLVRPDRNDPDIRARTRREAQALARLSHPNVVQVYEVGEYLGQVYLAMEHIQGQTLRAWQTPAARGWREVVAMYLQVGRGLAAAHACGLVHRDFKPDNVLVGDDQRPRVLDFGLARVRLREPAVDPAAPPPFSPPSDLSDRPAPPHLSEQPATSSSDRPTPPRDLSPEPASPYLSPEPASPHLSPEPAPLALDPTQYASPVPAPPADDARLTVPGAVLGTPAYMAPEQLVGGEADARSDVFSFCVALYEALLRVRPFPGDRSDTLLAAVQRGELARPERPPDVPAWLLRLVERGLAADRTRRWPGMDPLLLALARDPTRTRRRLAAITVGLALAAAAIYALLVWLGHQQAAELAAEQARTAETEAELGRTRAVVDSERQTSEAHRLAQSAAQTAGTDPTLQLLLAIEAVRVHRDAGAPATPEAAQALRDALGNLTSTPFRPPGPHSIVDAVAESPDGAWFATGQRNGAVTLWSTADPRSPHVLLAPGDQPVRALTFSPTRLAALRDERGGPHVWTLPPTPVSSDIQPVRWDIPVADLDGLAWSPDGAALLTRVGPIAQLTAREHDDLLILRASAPARVLRGHTAQIHHALWSPDGGAILSAASDATARLWPPNGPTRVRTHKRPPSAVAFAQDGRSYAVAADRSIDIIPVGPGRPRRLTHAAPLLGLAFTAGGDLVTAHSDSKVRQWDPADGHPSAASSSTCTRSSAASASPTAPTCSSGHPTAAARTCGSARAPAPR